MPKASDQIGPYTLLTKLGRGAFGIVWLAERRSRITTTKVALKLPIADEVDLAAVKREADVWAQASGHPNVLPIIEADVYGEHVAIASEYAPDGSLESWLERYHGKAPSLEVALDMTSGILAGLEHLHAQSIIHRDLKPANILLQRGIPRLSDFGISRVLKTTSHNSAVAGTPAYMAPEAFDGKRSRQTDLWSVGIILYQLLAGKLPFPQPDMASLLAGIITRDLEPLPASIPMPLQRIVERALKKYPDERYGSATEMRRALRDATQSLPISDRDLVHDAPTISMARTDTLPSDNEILVPTKKPYVVWSRKSFLLLLGVLVIAAISVVAVWTMKSRRISAAPDVLPGPSSLAGVQPTAIETPSPSPSPLPSPSPSPSASPSPSPRPIKKFRPSKVKRIWDKIWH
jgi:serine/threonine protein kinase